MRLRLLQLTLGCLTLVGISIFVSAVAQEEIKLGGRRIVGGEKTDIQFHPWQTALVVKGPNGNYLCGGSIVAHEWVLTAAHCFTATSQSSDVRAKAGATNYLTGGLWNQVAGIVIHEDYDAKTFEHDVALVKLRSPPNGRVIPLIQAAASLPAGVLLEVTGWGVSEEGSTSGDLLKARVPYVDTSDCNMSTQYNGRIRAGMMCAGYREGGIDSCQGDSGGPLVWRGPDGPVLAGIVSFGEGCARRLKYGVYTRVSAYRAWIDSKLIHHN
jgi:secreted trypsin-like serine protease